MAGEGISMIGKEGSCLKVISIAAGLASILGLFVAICAWLNPFEPFKEPTVPPPFPSPTHCVWSMRQARVAEIKFFEGGREGVSLGERVYATRFSLKTARYIYWEVTIDNDCPAPQREAFVIEAIYYKPDGSIAGQFSANTYVDAGWDNSVHSFGWGNDELGSWVVGRYRVSLRIAGLLDVSDSFNIDP